MAVSISKSRKMLPDWYGIAFIIFGLVELSINVVAIMNQHLFIQNAAKTSAVVVKIYSSKYHPEFEFTNKEGKQIKFIQNGFHKGYEIGEQAAILYSANNPDDARVESFGVLWGEYIIWGVIGLAFIIVGWFKLKNPETNWLYFSFKK